MGMLGLLKRIKLRFPRRRGAENPLPVVSWQELDQGDEAEVLQQMKEDAEREVMALQDAMRGPN